MGSFQIKSEDGNAVVHDVVLDEICNALSISNHDINLNSSFIHLGGHSLSAILVASACRSRNVRISVESILRGKSLSEILSCSEPISNPSKSHRPPLGVISPNMAHKPDKMLKRATKIGRPQRAESCQPSTVSEAVCSTYSTTTSFRTPMTEMQMSLIHGNRNHPGTNIISFFETYRSQDVPAMRQAWKTVINSEEIFRTSFDLNDGRADLVSEVPIPFLWEEVVVDTHDAYETELEEDQYASRIGTHFKVVTWQISAHGPAISTIIWRTHHALVDGFSATLLYVKLRDVLKGLPIKAGTPFTEVATGLNTLQQASRTSSKKFWEKSCLQNSGASSKLLLPQPKSEGSLTNETKTLTLKAPMDLLSAHARQLGVSLATLYHAAWALILSIYTDSNTVTFGVVLSGRNLPLPGVEDTVGPLINTLPLHLLLDEQLAVADFIGHVFHRLIDLGSVQFSRPQDGFSRDFSFALAAEFEMVPSNLDTPQPISRSYFTTVTDIPLSILIGSDGTLRICYHSNEYGDLDIELLVEHYHRALLMILSPDATIEICKDGILGPKSRDLIWEFGNCSSYETTAASICDDLVTLFELAAVDNPSTVAVEKGPVTLTYGDLNRMSDNLSTLLSHLIKPGDVVCVNADRSILWIIAIYGILKAGGVYSPLDPSLPNALRDSNFQISGAKIFLISQLADRSLKPPSCENCLAIEELLAGSQPDTALLRNSSMRSLPTPSANAYMCFTSGSTGKPKGVMCSHEGLVAFQKALEVRLFAQPGCRISQIMSPAFDGSIHEIFSALSYGATLVLANSTDPFSHLALVDSAILTPSTAKLLDPEDYPKLRNLYLVGEPVPQHVADVWGNSKVLYNMYGPTEGTCGATIKRLLPGKPVNIGPPNPSTRVYILDRNQRLVPPGVIGEICLAGVQIARGYIGRSTETAERFLKDTISGVPGERMYRTGDRGYWNSHGEIECLGRNDRQIKLRGFRLDLNDLEIRIANAIPEITAVAITQKDDYLVAMVQPASLEVAEVRSKIVQALQPNAVPRLIKAVDKFPITPIGKVDYKAIVANMDSAILISTRLLNTSTEKTLATEWRKYLVLEEDVPITCDSSFTCLGGHSVSQMLLASGLTSVFQCQIPVSLVIQSATLRDLALAIDYVRSEQPPSNDGLGEVALGEHKISPMEREWWRKYQLNHGTSSFNVNFACGIEVASVDIDRLIMSWNVVLARHLILCSQYVADEELGVKRIYSEAPPMVNRVASVDVEDEINLPFYLDRQDPIRVTISGSVMVVVISHIICDLTTLQILFREVANVYSGKCLSSVNKSYMDTTLWNKLAPSPDLAFWKDYLGDMPNSTHTSIICGRKSYTGTSYAVKIPKSVYQRLARFVTAHNYTMHQVVLASVAIALQRDSSATDIILGGPYQNRLSESDLDTVGLFLEPLPIRVSYTPGQQSGAASQAFLQSVQQSSQSALAHAVPWNQLLSHFQITPEFPNHPLLETMVTFHDDPHATKLAVPGLEPLLTWTEGSKFKLLCEFSALSEQTLLLRLEYDTDCFSKREVKDLASLISMGLEGLVDGVEYEEIKKGLRGVVKGDLQGRETGESDEPEASEKKDLFELEKIVWGTRLSEL